MRDCAYVDGLCGAVPVYGDVQNFGDGTDGQEGSAFAYEGAHVVGEGLGHAVYCDVYSKKTSRIVPPVLARATTPVISRAVNKAPAIKPFALSLNFVLFINFTSLVFI